VHSIVGVAMKVHRHFGPGFAEVVYQNAMLVQFRRLGLGVLCQHPLKVYYEDVVVGEFVADFLVEERLLVELKSTKALDPSHEAQIVNYLHATGRNIGLLLNFGTSSLQFRTKTPDFTPPHRFRPDLSA